MDIDGNCSPGIILTQDPDNSDERLIEIYTSKREDKNQYCLTQVIHLSNRTKLGAFAITKVNDEKSESVAPMLDILIPYIDENKIKILKNKKEIGYSWSDDYCNDIYEKKKMNLNMEEIMLICSKKKKQKYYQFQNMAI